MPDVLWYLLAVLLLIWGFACLALGMERHWWQLRAGPLPGPGTMRGLRLSGASGLAASLVLCLQLDHVTIAVLVWIMALVPAVLAVTFILSWRPGWFAPLLWWTRALGKRPVLRE